MAQLCGGATAAYPSFGSAAEHGLLVEPRDVHNVQLGVVKHAVAELEVGLEAVAALDAGPAPALGAQRQVDRAGGGARQGEKVEGQDNGDFKDGGGESC